MAEDSVDFRQEVIDRRNNQLAGSVLLRQPVGLKIGMLIVGCLFGMLLLVMALGSYQRKLTLTAMVVPVQSAARIMGDPGGVVEKIWVASDEPVKKGQSLVSIRQYNQTNANAPASPVSELIQARDNYASQLKATKALNRAKLRKLVNQISGLKLRLSSLPSDSSEHADLSAQVNEMTLNAEQILPAQHELEETQLARQIQLMNQLISSQQGYISELVAPLDGIATNILTSVGDAPSPIQPLLTVLPEEPHYYLRAYATTRDIGLLKKGLDVKVKYQSYPFRRYGIYRGRVENIAKTGLVPSEVDDILVASVSEPLYPIKVMLDQQQVVRNGEVFAIQSGMLADIDIVLESFSVLEWVVTSLLDGS